MLPDFFGRDFDFGFLRNFVFFMGLRLFVLRLLGKRYYLPAILKIGHNTPSVQSDALIWRLSA